jgi:hypothetical protein
MRIRTATTGLIAAVAVAICGTASSTASALCLKTLPTKGTFLQPNCTEAGKGSYIEVESLGTEIASGLYCAKVTKKETGWNKEANCSDVEKEKGEFIKVLLAGWYVNGTKLANGATLALATSAQVEESAVLNVPSLGIRLTCTGGSAKNLKGETPFIQGPDSGGAGSLTLEGCSEIEPAGPRHYSTPVRRVVGAQELPRFRG